METIPYKLQELCKKNSYTLDYVIFSAGTLCCTRESFEDRFGREFGDFYVFCSKYNMVDLGSSCPPQIDSNAISQMTCEFNTLHDFPVDVHTELSSFVGEHLSDCYFVRVSDKKLVCVLRFKNGFDVIGTAGCIDPQDYDAKIGAKYALRDAVSKAGTVVGFLNQELKHNGQSFKKDIP